MRINKNIVLLYIFSFFKNFLIFGAVSVPFYLHKAGLDYKGMFILEAVFSIGMVVFEIPTGIIADKFGRKISLLLGTLVFGGSFFIFGFVPVFHILIVAQIICALGMTMLSGADRALLYEVIQKSKASDKSGRIMARYDAFGTAGMLVAFPLGSLFVGSGIVSYTDALGLVFIATALAILLSGVFILFVTEDRGGIHSNTSISSLQLGINGFFYTFKHPKLRVFGLNYALISSLTFFMFWFYQALLLKNHFPVTFLGFVASGFNFTAMILLFFTPFFEKKPGIKNTLFLSSLIPGVLYILSSFIPGVFMAFIAIFGVTNFRMLRMPMLNSLMNKHIEDGNRATVLSGISMIERLSTTLLYPIVGMLTDISLSISFLVLGIITVILSVLLRVEEETLV
ncbi:MAG: hypothetical protein A2015_15480 [Spirochaetes bacterium GWF1_31_7]|nr:MAG: hypothetical protein A2Y30_11900 [Spirochaetes bacterium GWE1_32_154]OHD47267.1 MAG: hypothetical protein A2Y29_02915 [Spirochaetes bacterium GWE2_31_10]OHD52139.1 MAG: hypothetical protein A2015_15480 [Spirochaetes bacterium GWF1_31_7]HBD96323.1 hypothetical protein [Spirochaetia bacterium]